MIKNVLLDFIYCWMNYNDSRGSTIADAADQINRGDCGLAAIAVSHVLSQKYGMKVDIFQNINHCWFRVDGVDYDTLYRDGYTRPVKDVWNRMGGSMDQHLTFAQACEEWMPCDAHGGYLVKAWVERYGLTMPPELQHCIDKAAEYESPESIPGLVARAARLNDIPLPEDLR